MVAVLIVCLLPTVKALDFVGIDTKLDYSNANVSLTVTFSQPQDSFIFTTIGDVSNLNSIYNCSVVNSGVSTISCNNLNLTTSRTIQLNFILGNAIKKIAGSYYFSADYNFNTNIKSLSATTSLPEGAVLTNNTIFPSNSTIVSNGKEIIVAWNLNDLGSEAKIFQVLYEPVNTPINPIIYVGVVLAVVIIFGVAIYYTRYYTKKKEAGKSKTVVMSVLDEFEKKIIVMAEQAGGEINQKNIVRETGWSNAKTTRVVKRLAERGMISVERIGRHNKIKILKKE
jgi:uncharacterized membrane protein